MLVKKMTEDSYKALIEYSIHKINMFSLQKYEKKFEYVKSKFNDICRIIFSDLEFSEDFVFNNYSNQLVDEICQKYGCDKRIYEIEKENLQSFLEKMKSNTNPGVLISNTEQYIYESINASIRHSLEMFIYNKRCQSFNVLNEKYSIKPNNSIEENSDFFTKYFFKLDSTNKNILLNKKNIYDWVFPNGLEDLCLYKNNKVWLYSVAHEEICDICCESKEEYEYLKSIGIEFWQDEYTFD